MGKPEEVPWVAILTGEVLKSRRCWCRAGTTIDGRAARAAMGTRARVERRADRAEGIEGGIVGCKWRGRRGGAEIYVSDGSCTVTVPMTALERASGATRKQWEPRREGLKGRSAVTVSDVVASPASGRNSDRALLIGADRAAGKEQLFRQIAILAVRVALLSSQLHESGFSGVSEIRESRVRTVSALAAALHPGKASAML
ncbi:hypothetical protein LTR66_014927 [Elasticomyces elasticus]|nr:hypothetical protein LTR66_014927 [Elasticomyces elasticus]